MKNYVLADGVGGQSICLRTAHGKFVSPQPNGTINVVPQQQAWEKISVEHHQGRVALKSHHNKYLSAQPDGRLEWNRDQPQDWEKFHMEHCGNGQVALKTHHGGYLSAQPDGRLEGNRPQRQAWETFFSGPC